MLSKIILTILLFASGLISRIFYDFGILIPFVPLEYIVPGFVFGVIFSIAQFNKFQNIAKIFVFILGSTVAYFVAYLLAFVGQYMILGMCWDSAGNCGSVQIGIVYFIAGSVGALILAKAYNRSTGSLPNTRGVWVTGGIAALISPYLTYVPIFFPHYTLLSFLIWQITVGLHLRKTSELNTFQIDENTKKKNRSFIIVLTVLSSIILWAFYSTLSNHLESIRTESQAENAQYNITTDPSITQLKGWVNEVGSEVVLIEVDESSSEPSGAQFPLRINDKSECSIDKSYSKRCLDDSFGGRNWKDGDRVRVYGRMVNNVFIVKAMIVLTALPQEEW